VSDGSCNIVAIERKQLVNHVFTDESFLEYEKEIHYIRNIHSKSTRDTFSLPTYTHALQKQLPRLSQTGAHSGLGLQADYGDHHTRQGRPRQAKARPSETNQHDNNSQKASQNHFRNHGPTVGPLPQRVSPCKPFPNPSLPFPSINQSIIHHLIHHIQVLTRLINILQNYTGTKKHQKYHHP
jgi:hypothetical protein